MNIEIICPKCGCKDFTELPYYNELSMGSWECRSCETTIDISYYIPKEEENTGKPNTCNQ